MYQVSVPLFLWRLFGFINFDWSTVALQCWVSFDCTAKGISHRYTHIPSLRDFLPSGVTAELYVSRVPCTIQRVLSSHKSQYLNAIKIFLTHTFHCRLCDPLDGNQGCFCLEASCSIRPSFRVSVAEKQERRTSHLLLNALD